MLLCAVALVSILIGLWCRGFRCALRRLLVTFALGIPLSMGLLYTSCLIDGRALRLGPEAAARYVPASLHTQTNRGTGLLSPRQLVRWHYQRGFRVLNVSDRNNHRPGLEAQEAAMAEGFAPTLLVLTGEEWHASPDLVLVNTKQSWGPERKTHRQVIEGVHADGGAVFVAHPWSKLEEPLDSIFADGVDGIEVMNGVIHGGTFVLEKARQHKKSLLGVLDYKFGPHVNVMTLLPARLARTARGVVTALRERQTRIVYAVPGGAVTPARYKAGTRAVTGAVAGLRSLLETPRARRATWLAWIAGFLILWWIAARPEAKPPRSLRRLRAVFAVCCIIEFALPVALWWEARNVIGVYSVHTLLAVAAVVAVPLLLSTRALARAELEA